MKSRYKVVDQEGIYFITSSIIEWLPVFTSEDTFRIISDSLHFCLEEKSLKLYGYVITLDHLHMIVSSENLSEVMKSFKRHTAKEIIKYLKQTNNEWILNQFHFYKKKNKIESEYQVWQEGFHLQLISSYEMMEQKIEYMHQNPVRKGFVNNPEYWKYSSACNLDFKGNPILELNEIEFD